MLPQDWGCKRRCGFGELTLILVDWLWPWRTDSSPDVRDSWAAFAFYGQGILQGKMDTDVNLDTGTDVDRENSFSFSF